MFQNNVHWLVNSELNPGLNNALKHLGKTVTFDFNNTALAGEPFIYGPIGFVRKRSKEIGYGSYINPETMSVAGSYPFYEPSYLLNDDYIIVPFHTVKKDLRRFQDMFGGDFFIRSNSGMKIVPGQVVRYTESSFDLETIEKLSSAMPETLCVLASVKNIINEYRLVMTTQFETGSRYSWNDTHHTTVPADIVDFANRLTWHPEVVYILDIAETLDGPKIIEVNSASSSGLYGSDIVKYINAVEKSIINY